MTDFATIFTEAKLAAKEAADAMCEKIGGDRYSCGVAWVQIPDGRSPFVNWLKKQIKEDPANARIYGDKHWSKGWSIWNPSEHSAQNIDIKEAGAQAFSAVLEKYGITSYAGSRLD
jgi:hypothetical protein